MIAKKKAPAATEATRQKQHLKHSTHARVFQLLTWLSVVIGGA